MSNQRARVEVLALSLIALSGAAVAAPSPSVSRGDQARLERVKVTIKADDLKRSGQSASGDRSLREAAEGLGCPSDQATPVLSAALGVDEGPLLVPARPGSNGLRQLARWEADLRDQLARGGEAELTVELRYRDRFLAGRPDELVVSARVRSSFKLDRAKSMTIALAPCAASSSLASVLTSRDISAARKTMAWMAVGSGFSCAIEPKSKTTVCLPGEDNAYFVTGGRPSGRVDRYGGHVEARRALTRLLGKSTGDPIERTYRGGSFVVEARSVGSTPGFIRIGYNSGQLNPNREMEAEVKSAFRARLREMTGMRE